jgi:hypothetical protein
MDTILNNKIMNYDKEYFIKKFEGIPENEIGSRYIENKCALYHCGINFSYSDTTKEAKALIKLFGGKHENDREAVWWINDMADELGASPKERILNKLKSL